MATILVVDDEPTVQRVVQTTLEIRNHTVLQAEDGATALATVANRCPDLILLDWMLPDMSGLAVCQALRAQPLTAQIPIIFLTALDDLARKVDGLESGADDYVTKPFEPEELLARVHVQLRNASTRTQLNPLTQLPGNSLIEQAIADRVATPERPFALLYFDLNDFKAYNDFFGFSWGDQLLKVLARVIRQALLDQGGGEAFLGHVGGDDFVAIAPPEQVPAIADQAIREFDQEALALCQAASAPHGFVGVDRAGQTRRFGPPTLAIGVITNEQRGFTSYLEIGQVAAQVKAAAKRQPGSACFVDRRHSGDADLVDAPASSRDGTAG